MWLILKYILIFAGITVLIWFEGNTLLFNTLLQCVIFIFLFFSYVESKEHKEQIKDKNILVFELNNNINSLTKALISKEQNANKNEDSLIEYLYNLPIGVILKNEKKCFKNSTAIYFESNPNILYSSISLNIQIFNYTTITIMLDVTQESANSILVGFFKKVCSSDSLFMYIKWNNKEVLEASPNFNIITGHNTYKVENIIEIHDENIAYVRCLSEYKKFTCSIIPTENYTFGLFYSYSENSNCVLNHNNVPFGILRFDLESRVVTLANNVAANLLKYTNEFSMINILKTNDILYDDLSFEKILMTQKQTTVDLLLKTTKADQRVWVRATIFLTSKEIEFYFYNIETEKKLNSQIRELHHTVKTILTAIPNIKCILKDTENNTEKVILTHKDKLEPFEVSLGNKNTLIVLPED